MSELLVGAVVALVVGCGCLVETFTAGNNGVVYQCDDGTEWCSVLNADELGEAMGGLTCMRTERAWPRLTNAIGNGCVYSCVPHSGCNAKNGCWCPP